MSCITSSLIRADAPSVGASSAAAASAIARVCWPGCGVHVLGDAARGCRLSLGLAPLDAKSLGVHSRSQALVLGPRRVGVFHRAEAHRPCALRGPALGERAPALDQVVDRAASETRSEEGLIWTWDTNSVRNWSGLVVLMTRMCSVGYSSRFLGAAPVSTGPVDGGTCALGAVTCRQTRYSQLTRP
jgi:hypothetical protein